MDLEIVILNEVRNRQISYDFTYMCNLKYGTNELIYQKKKKQTNTKTTKKRKQTHRHRKQTYGYQRRKGVAEG